MTALATATPLAVYRSRKLIPEFRLHRPRSAAEAVAMKAAAGPGAVYMAGRIDVVNRMKSGLQVTDVIHLGAVAELDDIEEAEDGLQLGALVTHDQLASSPLVKARLPALAQTWPDVAKIRIRCKGTIGGTIMAGDPSYDFALTALRSFAVMSDFDHGLDLSHLTVWPPQPTTLAGIGLIALAIFQRELAIPALVAGLVAIIGDDKTHLDRKPPEPGQ